MAEENKTKENLIVDGYFFMTKEDAQRAISEKKKIRLIEERIHYDHPEEVLEIYNKVIKESLFKTPLGLQYLKGIQEFLLKSDRINRTDIYSIPVYPVASKEKEQKEKAAEKRREQKRQEQREKDKNLFRFSVFLNIAMAIALVCMFWIAIASPNANMINYEKAITNQYAEWEQELTEREKSLREKERAISSMENDGKELRNGSVEDISSR